MTHEEVHLACNPTCVLCVTSATSQGSRTTGFPSGEDMTSQPGFPENRGEEPLFTPTTSIRHHKGRRQRPSGLARSQTIKLVSHIDSSPPSSASQGTRNTHSEAPCIVVSSHLAFFRNPSLYSQCLLHPETDDESTEPRSTAAFLITCLSLNGRVTHALLVYAQKRSFPPAKVAF